MIRLEVAQASVVKQASASGPGSIDITVDVRARKVTTVRITSGSRPVTVRFFSADESQLLHTLTHPANTNDTYDLTALNIPVVEWEQERQAGTRYLLRPVHAVQW